MEESVLIFRRISEADKNLKLKTGNKAFNGFNPDETLRNYFKQDILNDGSYYTYLLIEESNN